MGWHPDFRPFEGWLNPHAWWAEAIATILARSGMSCREFAGRIQSTEDKVYAWRRECHIPTDAPAVGERIERVFGMPGFAASLTAAQLAARAIKRAKVQEWRRKTQGRPQKHTSRRT